MSKISIRFFNDKEVRAVWDETNSKWWFSVVDVCGALSDSANPRRYWSDLKRKIAGENTQLYEKIVQLKMLSADKKRYLTDMLDSDGIISLVSHLSNRLAKNFLAWFIYSDNTIDGQSKKKAYDLFESGLLDNLDAGTIKSLKQIHAYIFGGLYDFAGQIRTKNISKNGFTFAPCQHFSITLPAIERMPETTLDEIIDKYVEMNVAHPFMEGNGRSTRIWLDLMLKRTLKKCVDWSKINKKDYLSAMKKSVSDSADIKNLIKNALTNKINDREMFMKGIDYSYYYEEEDIIHE